MSIKNHLLVFFFVLLSTCALGAQNVLILGGGVGGITAANALARAQIPVVVIEGEESLFSHASNVENWPGIISISGSKLLEDMKKQAIENGVIFVKERVKDVDFSKTSSFVVTTESLKKDNKKNEWIASHCIIAMGRNIGHLDIKGANKYIGRGVYNCAACDGLIFKGKNVAILGSGDSAISQAEYLSKIAKKVFIISNTSTFNVKDKIKMENILNLSNVEVFYNTRVKEAIGSNEKLQTLILQKEERSFSLQVDGLFHTLNLYPNTAIFKDKIKLDKDGFIIVDDMQKTSVNGIYAVGDITEELCKQALVAAAAGTKAAFYIQKEYKEVSLAKVLQYKIAIGKPILLEFYATWCTSCKKVEPFMQDALVKMHSIEIVKINIDQEEEVAKAFNITAIPTAIFFDKGIVVKKAQGFIEVIDLLSEIGNNY